MATLGTGPVPHSNKLVLVRRGKRKGRQIGITGERENAQKASRTRQEIIRKAGFQSFNQKRIRPAAATFSDLMRATGLEKGGIYRHFGSKQELAGRPAFDHAWKNRNRYAPSKVTEQILEYG